MDDPWRTGDNLRHAAAYPVPFVYQDAYERVYAHMLAELPHDQAAGVVAVIANMADVEPMLDLTPAGVAFRCTLRAIARVQLGEAP